MEITPVSDPMDAEAWLSDRVAHMVSEVVSINRRTWRALAEACGPRPHWLFAGVQFSVEERLPDGVVVREGPAPDGQLFPRSPVQRTLLHRTVPYMQSPRASSTAADDGPTCDAYRWMPADADAELEAWENILGRMTDPPVSDG